MKNDCLVKEKLGWHDSDDQLYSETTIYALTYRLILTGFVAFYPFCLLAKGSLLTINA